MEENLNTEEEQKLNNQVKKLKIELETGAKFFTPNGIDLPADVEAEFLDNIIAFEEAAKKAETKTIGEILGNPVLIPEDGLTDEQIHEELTKFYKLLDENNVNFDVIYETPEREIYQFICTEFVEHVHENINIPGFISRYEYEDFMPNDEGDLRSESQNLFENLFVGDFEFLEIEFADEVIFKGKKWNREEFMELLEVFYESTKIELKSVEIEKVEIQLELGKAEVTGFIQYVYWENGQRHAKMHEEFTLCFVNPKRYWEVEQMSLLGLGF